MDSGPGRNIHDRHTTPDGDRLSVQGSRDPSGILSGPVKPARLDRQKRLILGVLETDRLEAAAVLVVSSLADLLTIAGEWLAQGLTVDQVEKRISDGMA